MYLRIEAYKKKLQLLDRENGLSDYSRHILTWLASYYPDFTSKPAGGLIDKLKNALK